METVKIGTATLIHGDAVEILPSLESPSSIVSDPPYGMAYTAKAAEWKSRAIANDDSDHHLIWACKLPARHSRYIFCRWDNLLRVPRPRSCITWVKKGHGAGDTAHAHGRQTESILFYPGLEHYFPAGRPSDVIFAGISGNAHHPTEKPVQLMMAVVGWTAGPVLDPFMGSGSTGVACARLGRPFVGIELDGRHFETACRRIEAAHCEPGLGL